MLPRIVTKDSRLQVFQYKLLSNVLYLNKMLFKFGKIDSPLCPNEGGGGVRVDFSRGFFFCFV